MTVISNVLRFTSTTIPLEDSSLNACAISFFRLSTNYWRAVVFVSVAARDPLNAKRTVRSHKMLSVPFMGSWSEQTSYKLGGALKRTVKYTDPAIAPL